MKSEDPIPRGLRPLYARPAGWRWNPKFVPAPKLIDRSTIKTTKKELARLNTLYFHCSTCDRWKIARSFYSNGKRLLRRYERDGKVLCRDCYQKGGDQ